MAGEDDKGKTTPRAGAAGGRKLDRRDVLKGLSTVPALGLFGYAWNKQRQYERAASAERAVTTEAPRAIVSRSRVGASPSCITQASAPGPWSATFTAQKSSGDAGPRSRAAA